MTRIALITAAILSVMALQPAHAGNTVINNNYPAAPQMAPAAPPAAPGSSCGQNAANNSYDSGQQAGVYTTDNGNGGTNTVYTTGEKKPFIVDNNCGGTPPIQPYVEYNAPTAGSGGTSTTGTTSTSSSTTPVPMPVPRR